ncbi:hypothetical protein L2965_03635 [Streptococcus pneumoniae]|nr:hypothetical protein [Streptococcus pneumoniae]MDV8223364.1 hypothetical protein [Streptococcus pneumoniae]MDV8295833.1 hypothetical protein [Streptococcus pneumoniae]MDV8313174.1 hypothetical protein [Streptococcus pneumoniae]MDV8327868.1 hypothetical protein [Streptococcus pneumoniae]
MVLLQY